MNTVEQVYNKRRANILQGNLTFPKIVLENIELNDELVDYTNIQEFWSDLWYSFLRENGLSTEIYYEKFNNHFLFNRLLFLLSKYGWIVSDVVSNYGTIKLMEDKILQWISKEELKELRFKYRMNKYKLRSSDKYVDNLVKIRNSYEKTGLIRKGFAKIKDNTFSYDLDTMSKYIYKIADNVLKGLIEDNKQVSYEEVVIELLAIINSKKAKYSTEKNISDSRGRSIFQCQKRVFNPISSKDARALLVIEPHLIVSNDVDSINSIFSFIAELNGHKGIGGTYVEKCNTGKNMYQQRVFNMEPEKDSLYEHIWLERIYKQLDTLFDKGQVEWNIPIEIDATASICQHIGVLTNNHVYLQKTNIIGDTIDDLWTIEGVDRNMVKKHFTRQLYGSTSTPRDTLNDLKTEYTEEDIIKLNKLSKEGIFKDADIFKNYIIKNVKTSETMNIKIWNDEFYIKCNKFKWNQSIRREYVVYTSKQGLFKTITRNLNLLPDLDRFKRYFVTLLCHNSDSQVANNICEEFNKWIIPNHDAFLVNPFYAKRIKELYSKNMYEIYKNRKEIINTYFNCLGIPNTDVDKDREELTYKDFNKDTILK